MQWTFGTVAGPQLAAGGQLSSVDCVPATECEAVGTSFTGAGFDVNQPLAEGLS
jgi:hypothetical protein